MVLLNFEEPVREFVTMDKFGYTTTFIEKQNSQKNGWQKYPQEKLDQRRPKLFHYLESLPCIEILGVLYSQTTLLINYIDYTQHFGET